MTCPQCRHENPAANRFCGMCGTKLPMPEVRVDPSAPTVTWLKSMEERRSAPQPDPKSIAQAEQLAREREVAERAERAARRERELARQKAREASAQSTLPAPRSGSSGAPSFLGLSGGYEPEPAAEPAEEYERNDIYGGGRSYTRALLLLVLLLVVGGLIFLQWRYSSGLRASPPAEKPPAAQPEQAGAETGQAAPENSEAKNQEELAGKGQSSSTNSATAGKPDGKQASVDEESASDEATKSQPEEPRTGKMAPPPSEPEKQAASNATDQGGKKGAAPADNATKEQADAKAKPPARIRAQKEQPAEVSDEPVRLAENYIYGRGLRQSCPQAISILREASNRGNYKAQIKLGALYATGNCVSLDRVQAYRFLTRALQGKPGNTWVEQNRSMLWTQMSEQERQAAMEQNF